MLRFIVTFLLALSVTALAAPAVQTDHQQHQLDDHHEGHHEMVEHTVHHVTTPASDVSARHHHVVNLQKVQPVTPAYQHHQFQQQKPQEQIVGRHTGIQHSQTPVHQHHQFQQQQPQQQPQEQIVGRHAGIQHSQVPIHQIQQQQQPQQQPQEQTVGRHAGFQQSQAPVHQQQFAHSKMPFMTHHHEPMQQKSFVHHGSIGQNIVEHKPHVTVQQTLTKSHVLEHEVAKHHHEDIMSRSGHQVVSSEKQPLARILNQDMEVNPDGSYYNVWKSDNGISVQEQGTLKQVDDTEVAVSNGEISYVDNEGNEYHLKYVADENGFHVEGAHLPTPPPVPQGIARGLEYIAAHPYVESTTYSSHEEHKQGQAPVVVDN